MLKLEAIDDDKMCVHKNSYVCCFLIFIEEYDLLYLFVISTPQKIPPFTKC